jgi:hypothetical protein
MMVGVRGYVVIAKNKLATEEEQESNNNCSYSSIL